MSESKPKPWGCAHYAAVAAFCFALFLFVVWYSLCRSVPLRISPETTYITEPLDATGKWVDYFHAFELKIYPPEMKTDDNGVRLIVRALGIGENVQPEFAVIYYEKLGLNPTVPPTHFYLEPDTYFQRAQTHLPQVYEAQKKKMYDKYVKKTLDEFRAETSRSEEDRERMIREWESGQKTEELPIESNVGFAENLVTGEIPFGFGMAFNSGPLPQDYATWEPDYKDLQFMNVPWTIEEHPLMEHWLHDNSPALDLIAEAVQKPAFAFPRVRYRDDDMFVMISMLLPDIQAMRAYARGLIARANYRIAQGNFDGAFDDMIACFRLGRRVGHEGTTVGALVGVAIEGVAMAVDFDFPGDKQPTAEQLRRLLDAIDNLPPRVKVEAFFETERFSTLESVQSIARSVTTGSGSEQGASSALGIGPPAIDRVLSLIGTDWNVVFKRINKAYDELDAGTLDEHGFNFWFNFWDRPYRALTLNSRSELIADLFISLLLPALDAAKEAMRRAECSFNLKRLTLAMLIYEKEHGRLPPTFTVDASGAPLHSWRVLLLPYLGEEAKSLYESIRLDEPWDSEHNNQFHETTLEVFQCPSAATQKEVAGGTHYAVIVGNAGGNGVLFGTDGQGRSANDFARNMLLIVERQDAVCWMTPNAEIPQTDAMAGINRAPTAVGSFHTGGCDAAMKAGGVEFFSNVIDNGKWQEMIVGTENEMP